MRINHNVPSIITQNALASNNRALGKDLEKLSTGLRINRANDDAAGLAVSEGLRTQIRGVEQAKKNAMDGMSALNIAEGAFNEIHAIMQRQRELAIQSSTATYRDETERMYMNTEFKQLDAEIKRIVEVTNFNKIYLLDTMRTEPGETIFVSEDGSKSNALQVDANHSGANLIWVSYAAVKTDIKSVDTTANAQIAISLLDEAIQGVSEARANIGAYVNRLESTINNLTVSSAMQTNAETQLRDVDFAYQSSQFTRNQILTQSATAMLSQANSVPQNVLSLLR
jgi:flagellin